jgi:small subunit ribosomal protein S6
MFIVKPDLDDEQVATATDRVHQLVVANGGNVTKTAAWGKRRLAYRVGQFREGHYVVSNFDIGSDKIVELERVLKISDTVFRHLIVRKPVLKPGAATNGETPPPPVEPELEKAEDDSVPTTVPTTAAAADAMAPAKAEAEEDEE